MHFTISKNTYGQPVPGNY